MRKLLVVLAVVLAFTFTVISDCGTCSTEANSIYHDVHLWCCEAGGTDSECTAKAQNAKNCYIIEHWPECSECPGMSPEGGCQRTGR